MNPVETFWQKILSLGAPGRRHYQCAKCSGLKEYGSDTAENGPDIFMNLATYGTGGFSLQLKRPEDTQNRRGNQFLYF